MDMDEDETALPAAKPRVRRVGVRKRRRKAAVRWSAKRAALFLATLAETANVARSARASGLSESTVRRHRQTDEDFAARWFAALREGVDSLQTMLLDRALNGVEKAVWHGGKQVGTIIEYSDQLALRLLETHRAAVMGAGHGAAAMLSNDEACAELVRELDAMNLRMRDPD